MDVRTVAPSDLPWLSIEQMIEADRLAIEEFGITLLQMMEHAGASLAALVDELAPNGAVVVLAGGGNNGGGGLCAARHLVNRGRDVSVVVASGSPGQAARHHLATLREMGIEPTADPPDAPVVVDALVGYGLDGPLRGQAAMLADWSPGHIVISLDFPSGHGYPGAMEPRATLTLALPKEGLRNVRPLYVADLGLPRALWSRMGLDVGPLFGSSRYVEVGP
ncbi:MAG: NAD(P)H-hydrate epimerase [Actinomycetota bacterium]